jgi:hypothetical protein
MFQLNVAALVATQFLEIPGNATGTAGTAGQTYDWWRIWWYWPVSGSGIAYTPGLWNIQLFIDGVYQQSISFTIRYQLTEHLMAKGVQSTTPFDPIQPSNIFYQTDQEALTWLNLDKVSDAINVKWIFYEPNGSEYMEATYSGLNPAASGFPYWSWYKFWGAIGITGNSAANKCGHWNVDVMVQDPSANWVKQYTDYFQIIESPPQPPICAVVLTSTNPISGQTLTLSASATDNTYLQSLVLYWNDGTLHSHLWNNVFSNSLNQSQSIGTYTTGQQIEYWAMATDTSGNITESIHRTATVVPATRIISLSGNLVFGNVITNTTAAGTLTTANGGNSTLNISSLNCPAGFSGNWSGAIPAGNSQNVSVTFSPTLTISYGGSIIVNSDATTGFSTIAVFGIGQVRPPGLVTTNTDDGSAGTLRQIVLIATNGETITFAPNLSGQTILLTNGQILLTNYLTIDASALSNGITINGNHGSRIFEVSSNANVVLTSLAIIYGFGTNGGGIYNSGTLTVNQSMLSRNSVRVATYYTQGDGGGGIYNSGTFTVNQSTLSSNSVWGGNTYGGGNASGGGIVNSGTLTIQASTLSANSVTAASSMSGGGSASGGGVFNSGTLTIQESTLSANSATGGNGFDDGGSASGGGIFNSGPLIVNQSTLSGNSATGGYGNPPFGYNGSSTGGGIYSSGTVNLVSLTNSILAGNGAVSGTNLYGLFTESYSLTNGTPLLAPLGNYGGPTPTMPPLPGSPAIDAGSDSVTNTFATDQRGLPRRLGLHVDIGAVEGGYNAAGPGALKGITVLGNGSANFTFTNFIGMSFTVLACTNVTLPMAQWSNLGNALETPVGSGHYQFTDPQAANNVKRFYRVRTP